MALLKAFSKMAVQDFMKGRMSIIRRCDFVAIKCLTLDTYYVYKCELNSVTIPIRGVMISERKFKQLISLSKAPLVFNDDIIDIEKTHEYLPTGRRKW